MLSKITYNGVNYWYDYEDKGYRFDRYGYESMIDISSIPQPVIDQWIKESEEN